MLSAMPDVQAIPLLSRALAGWDILACSTPRRWAFAPLQSASGQTKNISLPSLELTFTSTPKLRMQGLRCRSWEVPTSSWRPPPAEPQSPAYFLASPFAAGSLWLASQAIQFRSTEFRSSLVVALSLEA